jgi:general stress protein CsbA
MSVLSLYGILNRICRKKWAVLTTIAAFIFAQAFLNYFHTGAPYIPGLSLVLLAIYLFVTQDESDKRAVRTAVLAGASLAGAVLLWFPYILAVPAALVAPLFLFGFDKRRLTLSLQAAIAGAILGGAVYLAVMTHIGIHNVHEFREWMEKTSRGSGSSNKGIGKMVFGFARSFINMGNDGMLFKRFLLHDPFNPVSALDLLRLSLWKLVAFYLFLAFLFLSLITSSEGRRVLVPLVINCIPVIAFAIYWQGGDPERYLPLYPLLFIALAWSLNTERVKRPFKYPLIVFIAAMFVTNGFMMAGPRLNRQQEAASGRISPLVPILKSGSWVFTANWQDDLVNFNRSFPLSPINRNNNLRIGSLISPGEPEVAYWQKDFSSRVQSIWARGGDVWLSRRLLSPRPHWDWNWVEGDDARVSWNDLYRYASKLELGQSVGGDDGFVLLLPSERNRRVMKEP